MSEYYIPVPLEQAIKEYTDQELIEVISTTEFRLEKNKYDVNEAALVLYDTAKTNGAYATERNRVHESSHH